MPVVGHTIACKPPESTVNCLEQPVKQPKVTRYEGRPVVGRKRAVRFVQGQSSYIELPILNEDGNPVDLASCLCGVEGSSSSNLDSSSSSGEFILPEDCGIKVRMVEVMSLCSPDAISESEGEVLTPEKGLIRFKVPASAVDLPGVYECQIAGFSGGEMIFADELYILVEQGLFGAPSPTGPPSWKDVKLALHDSCRNDGWLMDEMEWDLAEVCQALIEPVRWWNEAKPLSGSTYTTTTFPFKSMWRRGAISHLYRVAAAHYRREYIAYTAAGVALNDKAKAPEYEQQAVSFESEFKTWAFQQKTASQAAGFFGMASANGCGRSRRGCC